MKINNILAKKPSGVFTIQPARPVREAIQLLAQHNIGALVVVNQLENVIGIVSERDIIKAFAERTDVQSLPIVDIMTQRVIFGAPQDDVMAVAHTMTERRFRHLPILDEGELIGIISIGDVLKSQRDEYEGQIDTLEIQIIAGDDSSG